MRLSGSLPDVRWQSQDHAKQIAFRQLGSDTHDEVTPFHRMHVSPVNIAICDYWTVIPMDCFASQATQKLCIYINKFRILDNEHMQLSAWLYA